MTAADDQPAGGSQDLPGPVPADEGPDALVDVRARLDGVLDLPLQERAEVFEDAHRVVVAELRALELG